MNVPPQPTARHALRRHRPPPFPMGTLAAAQAPSGPDADSYGSTMAIRPDPRCSATEPSGAAPGNTNGHASCCQRSTPITTARHEPSTGYAQGRFRRAHRVPDDISPTGWSNGGTPRRNNGSTSAHTTTHPLRSRKRTTRAIGRKTGGAASDVHRVSVAERGLTMVPPGPRSPTPGPEVGDKEARHGRDSTTTTMTTGSAFYRTRCRAATYRTALARVRERMGHRAYRR